jgi:hypothetical protein
MVDPILNGVDPSQRLSFANGTWTNSATRVERYWTVHNPLIKPHLEPVLQLVSRLPEEATIQPFMDHLSPNLE